MQQYLKKLLRHEDLSAVETEQIALALVRGELSPVLASATLTALAMKGETVEEIVALVKVLRTAMIKVEISKDAIDTCGTGGDGSSTLNASTLSAFVAAVAGVPIAKHGNRAISSKCGSFDLLEKFGINFNLNSEQAQDCFNKTDLVFLFASNFHPAFKHIMPIRKELGVRTIFNFLGPLLNPAGVKKQVIGVSSGDLAKKLGEALLALGSEHILIVSSQDGLDEVSVAAPTTVYEFIAGKEIKKFDIEPSQKFSLAEIKGGQPAENFTRSCAILEGRGNSAEREFIALNAGLSLYLGGVADSINIGIERAREILLTDAPLKKVLQIAKITNSL